MSFFECVEGRRYYPFGRGGRERILRGLSGWGLAASPSASNGTLERLRQCPLHCLPLRSHPDDDENAVDGDERQYPHPLLRKEYADLADSVLNELFRLQVDAVLVGILCGAPSTLPIPFH